MDVEQSPAFLRELRVTARIQDARRFAQPPWQTALFVVLSFGLYLLPWSNRCWHYCNAAWEASGQSTRRSPWRRSLTFLIPIYGWLYAYYRLATDVREMVDADAEAALEPGALDTIFAGSLLACKLLPIPWAAVGIVGLLTCVLTVQLEINRTCARMQPGVMAHTRLNRQALVGIPLGLLLWAGFGYLVIQQYKLSSGVAALSFGHGLDSNGFTLLQPSSTFGSGDHVAWSVHLNGRIGEASHGHRCRTPAQPLVHERRSFGSGRRERTGWCCKVGKLGRGSLSRRRGCRHLR